jgi:hypothetical protein
MKQAKNLEIDKSLSREKVLELLNEKIDSVDWVSAKADMHPFIPDPERLNIWSREFFHALLEYLLIE